jgi:long-chain acyl-CoA synthetase
MIEKGAMGPRANPRLSAEAPWLAFYEGHVPARIEPKHRDMLSVFKDAVARNPQGAALIYFDRTVSYSQLDADSDALAIWLRHHGIGRGDRVQVVAQNIPAFPLVCIAAWKVGAVPVPGNPMYRAPELARIFKDADPAAVLCQDAEAAEVAAGLAAAGLADIPLIVASPRDGAEAAATAFLPPSPPETPGEKLADIVLRHRGEAPEPIVIAPDDLGLILYTSGTTGVPKGAMLTHSNMAFSAEVARQWFSLGEGDRILGIAPFFHITGLICHVAVALRAGCAVVMNYRFEPKAALAIIRAQRPTFTIGAITAFNALMNLPEAGSADMASLTKVWSGGAPIPPSLRDAIRERLGFTVHNAYGMSELTSPAVLTPYGAEAPVREGVLSLGVPVPSTDIRIVDEAGAEQPVGVAGELLFRGPQMMAGYWRKPEENAIALVGGWMHTGDIGFRDERGWIYLVDRKKDVIIASGFKVWPREVEDVLYAHPAVREAVVVGVPDAYRGETVKACVSLVAGVEVTEQELSTYCRERLAAYKVPRLISIMDDLPKTITGKIRRVALRESGEA